MTGLELLRTTDTTVEEIADIISEHCLSLIHISEYLRMERRTQRETKQILNRLARHEPGSQCPHTPQDGEAGTP